jgi:hypothetical protein
MGDLKISTIDPIIAENGVMIVDLDRLVFFRAIAHP